jgi:hypothetical protein
MKITCPICQKRSNLITDWYNPILSCGCKITQEQFDKANIDELYNRVIALSEDGLTVAHALDVVLSTKAKK